jgi:hypothetical protein
VKVNPQTFFNFCSAHVPLLRQLGKHDGEFSEAQVARLIRDHPALHEELPETAWPRDARNVRRSVERATRLHGVFSFVLTPGDDYELCAPCALVEGPELLLGFERLSAALECPLVIYGGGRVSQGVLEWLNEQTAPEFYVLHLPDYDPVGLNEYVRLQTALGRRAKLHIPADLDDSFARFTQYAYFARCVT